MSCFIMTSCFFLVNRAHSTNVDPAALQHFSRQQDPQATRWYLRWEATAVKWLKSLIYQKKQLTLFSWSGCRQYCMRCAEHMMCSGLRLQPPIGKLNQFWWVLMFSMTNQGTLLRKGLSFCTASLCNSRSDKAVSRNEVMPGKVHLRQRCFHFFHMLRLQLAVITRPSACNTCPWVHIYLGCVLDCLLNSMRQE